MRQFFLSAAAIIFAAPAALASGKSQSVHDDGDTLTIMQIDDDAGNFWIKSDALTMKASWRGEFSFAVDGRSLTKLDGMLEISQGEGPDLRKAVFSGKGARSETEFFIGGRKQPMDAASREAVSDILLAFVRASGMHAGERVGAMLKAGGTSAVLAEINAITADHSARRYIVALAAQADLSAGEIDQLAERIAALDGDHAKRLALTSLLENQKMSPQSFASLLRAAEVIESDHDARLVLTAAASHTSTASGVSSVLKIFSGIESDHDARLAASAFLKNRSVSDDAAVTLLESAAAQISSDHELRLVLQNAAERMAGSDAAAKSVIQAISHIRSDHDARLAVMEAAAALPKSSAHWAALIGAVEGIGSDHDARIALTAIAGKMPRDERLLDAYRQAAVKIGSDRDRQTALAAIDRR